MELIFLGTASNNPSPHRAVSCTAIRFEGEVWLFDCGEGTQIQLMKSTLKPGKISKIFVTHLHGDHVFGLPGLMCTIGQNIKENKTLDIYGPVGLRRFLRTTLELSRSMVTYNYRVHEMVPIDEQIPDEIKSWKCIEREESYLHPSESLGETILIDSNGVWNLFENEFISVKSSWIKHRVACFGYVIQQKPLPGKLDVEKLKSLGIQPGPIYSKIKSGQNVTLPNGTIIEASEYIGPSRQGKKITLLGDCYECPESILRLAQKSDVLIHECTLENGMQEKAISNGHSTPMIATEVANKTNSKILILNHFSQRYKPLNVTSLQDDITNNNFGSINDKQINKPSEEDDDENDNVQKLLDEAKLTFNGQIFAAYDFFHFKV